MASNVTLENAITLITSKYTAERIDRHAAMVRRICSDKSPYSEGFYFKDLEVVMNLVEILIKGIEEGKQEYFQALQTLINHCKLDFRKEKSSDENNYVPLLPQFLEKFTPILKFKEESKKDLVLTICDFVTFFAAKETQVSAKSPAKHSKSSVSSFNKTSVSEEIEEPLGVQVRKKGTKYLRALANTTLPEAFVQLLADNVSDPEIAAHSVQAISAISIYAPLAQKIGELGALKDLVVVICSTPNFRDPLVNICIECIWNILEQSGQDSIETLAREELILSLQSTINKVITEGYKLSDRKLRNELMILVTTVVASTHTHPFFLSKEENPVSFLEQLIKYSSYDEVNLTSETPVKPMWGSEPEDLEFKKLLWTCVSRLISTQQEEAVKVIMNSNYLASMLIYLDPFQKNQPIQRWQSAQLKEIQAHALYIIYHILSIIPDHFQQQNGNYCLVHFLNVHQDIQMKLATLKVLEIASQFSEFKEELSEEGLFDNLLGIVEGDVDYPLSVRELALSIVSNACKDCRKNQKEIRRKGWIEIIKSNIKEIPPTVSGEPDQYLLAVLDCLWHAILQNKRSVLHFVDIEGVSTLLDYLDECPEIHRRLVVSCLCKVLTVQRAKSAFTSWNSIKNMSNASQLMVKLYEEEEKRLGVEYEEEGVLKNPERPLAYNEAKTTKGFERLREALLAGENQSEISVIRKKQLEVVRKRDLRASIYSCLSLVGFDVNELEGKERQKMEVIRMYPEFRKGELLLDIKYELETLGIRPITDDRVSLEEWLKESYEKASNTKKNQLMIAKDLKRQEEKSLEEFYQKILKNGKTM